MNIVDIAAGSDDFNLLVRALQTVDLVDTVRDATDVTVFAPTDAAFTQLASDLGFDGDATDEDAVFDFLVAALTDLGGGDPAPVLTDILLYHVSAGAKSEAEIEAAGSIATLLDGVEITPDGDALVDQEPDILNPSIVVPDIAATNGTIQGIDRVLLPIDIPGNTNIVDIAAGSDDFNLLVRALQTVDLVDTVRDATDVTVFAPTDAAFTQLASDLGFDGDATDEDAVFDFLVAALTDLGGGDPAPVLTDILLYHVSAGAKSEAEIEAAGSITTLLDGVEITPDGDALVDQEPDILNPSIIAPDIAASNGTIQGIDRVLLPIDIAGNDRSTITEIVAASGDGFDTDSADFDILLSAVVAAGLTDALSAENADLTVFAPNDGAFIGLAQALGYQGDDEEGSLAFILKAATLLSKGADPLPLLTDILTYHVVPGARDATAVLGASELPTLQGESITVDGTTLIDQDPDIADPNIIATDIFASNGIVHALDGVLIPADILQSDGSDKVDFVIGDDTSEDFDLGADNDWVDAGGGDDTVKAGEGNDVILGGAGTDRAILTGDSDDYGLQISAEGVTVINKTSDGMEEDFLKDVELLELGDGFGFLTDDAIDLDTLSGAANLADGQLETLVELYVAYFNRAPDALGILFWGNALEDGVSLPEIAELFFDQPEARSKLPPESDVEAFVDLAYSHLLERSADDAGRTFWVEQLESGNVSRPEFMLELIAGARANSEASEDIRTIEDKTDIGVSYALIEGLTSATDASTVLDAYDRDDAAASLATAQGLIDGFAEDASGVHGTSALTVQLIGVVDDPFIA